MLKHNSVSLTERPPNLSSKQNSYYHSFPSLMLKKKRNSVGGFQNSLVSLEKPLSKSGVLKVLLLLYWLINQKLKVGRSSPG